MDFQRGYFGETSEPPSGSHQPTRMDTNVIGLRGVATIIDVVLIIVASTVLQVVLAFFLVLISMVGGVSEDTGSDIGATLSFPFAVIVFLAYYLVLEGSRGQTLGKMLVGIRVVGENTAGVSGVGAVTVRTLMRFVDGFLFYLVAIIVVVFSQKNQRLGDMLARTLVVRR